ncbi:protein MODIFIER OF SNC1 1 [Forsythia ovata]|uniref:Protein MODIFIER OF SNC1 1 n=1 Tax=Forsythia ovata TaxID=205694 RepID=A0ABD1R244_9LAMI
MRETAKQRALQLQKEEEERTREQKAKALAKLEELNRRTKAGEAGTQKAERTQGTQNAGTTQVIGVIQGEQEESRALAEQATVDLKFEAPGPTLVSESGVVSQDTKSGASHDRDSANMPRDLPLETLQTIYLEHISHGQSSPLKQDSYNAGATISFESDDGSVSRHKGTGYKQKQNYPSQKNLNEKSALIVTGEALKELTDVTVNDVTLTEVTSSVRASGETNAPNISNIMAEPATQQRRKSNRNSKNKHRLDEAAEIPPILSVTPEETNPAKESIENGKSKASLSDLDSLVSAKIEPDGGVQASVVQSSLDDEEAHGRVSKQWKPQSRRMPRSLQANRIMDKFHSNDTVIWAPVRSQSKVEGSVEASQKSTPESVTPVKIDNLVQNSSKSKRAEMERYVPKPVAKELAQQGSIQPVPFSTSPTPEEAVGKAQPESARSVSPPPNSSVTGIVGSGVDFKEGDGRHNKQGKAHGTWRQRNLTEPSNRKSMHHGPSATSNPSKDIQRSTDLNQFVKRELNASKSEPNTSSVNNALDSSNMSNDIESAAAGKSLAVKDQVATGRGKRYLSKGHKSMGNNHDPEHKNIVSGESVAADVNQTERTISSKESHGSGERMSSHWQPKSHTNSENNQHRGKAARSETVTVEIDRASKRDHHPQRKVHVPPQDDKNCEVDRPHPDEFVPESNMADERNVGHPQESIRERKPAPVKDVGYHQDSVREWKPAPAKGRPYSPSQVPVGVGESAPAAANMAGEHERNFPSGFRRNGNQNNRSGRGHESHGDWSSGHDSRQHNVPTFRERQRQNVHFEYQPVGQYKNSKTDKLVGSGDGSNDVAPRYRERNQSHSKRDGGNFNRRQGGPAPVDSGRD